MYAIFIMLQFDTYALLIERREWRKGIWPESMVMAANEGSGLLICASIKRATHDPSMDEIVRLRAFCGGWKKLRHCSGEWHRVDGRLWEPAGTDVCLSTFVCMFTVLQDL